MLDWCSSAHHKSSFNCREDNLLGVFFKQNVDKNNLLSQAFHRNNNTNGSKSSLRVTAFSSLCTRPGSVEVWVQRNEKSHSICNLRKFVKQHNVHKSPWTARAVAEIKDVHGTVSVISHQSSIYQSYLLPHTLNTRVSQVVGCLWLGHGLLRRKVSTDSSFSSKWKENMQTKWK